MDRETYHYTDEKKDIFFQSAVVDVNNTSGFGSLNNPPMVAMFTYHDMKRKKLAKLTISHKVLPIQ
jgi:levanase/fructan beta-fructosidase